MAQNLDLLRTTMQTVLRGGAGHRTVTHGTEPALPLTLYEFEGCPFCRRVREALSALDLDAIIVPCPRGGRHREAVVALGGKMQFPFLVDPNTQQKLYESADIIAYLSETYGQKARLWQHQLPLVDDVSGKLTRMLQHEHGRQAQHGATAPKMHLHLWSFEASPYCKLVREVLCELEIPYLLHNVARGGARRDAHEKEHGKVMVPYLEDPNTDTKMYESEDIVRYLKTTYGA